MDRKLYKICAEMLTGNNVMTAGVIRAMAPAAVTALAMLLASCDMRAYIHDKDGGTQDVIADRRQDEFLCIAVTFPEGYNWYRDSLSGNVATSLELYLNNSLVRRIPVLPEKGVCADSDRHVLYGSHILSHARYRGRTLVSLDGEPVQEYESDEVIRSLLMHGKDIYTLSDNAEQMTWSLRVNGEVMATQNRSLLCDGGLYIDDGQVCFAYMVVGRGGSYGEYHMVHGATDEVVYNETDKRSVKALRQVGGEAHILVADKDGVLVWHGGEDTRIIYFDPKNVGMTEFVNVNGTAFMHITIRFGGSWRELLLDKTEADIRIPDKWQIYSFCDSAPLLCYACCPNGRTSPVMIKVNGRESVLEDHMMVSPTAIALSSGGVCHMGVNRKNLRPEVIHGADTLSYDFNGYVTYISLP